MGSKSEAGLVWPLTVLAGVATLLLVASLIAGAHGVDRDVRLREQALVHRGMLERLAEFENALAAQTVWDEAVTNLDNRLDPQWARSHLPAYLKPTIGVWDYLVMDGEDRPVWASHDLAPEPKSAWAENARRAAPMVAELREMERQRALTAPRAPGVPPRPIILTRFEPRDGLVYMWMASVVLPDQGQVRPRGPRAALVVANGPITAANIENLSQRFGLNDLHIERELGRIRSDEAFSPISVVRGAPPLYMAWKAQTPGADLLAQSVWIILAVLLTFLALAAFMFNNTRRAARNMIAVSRAQAEFLANMSHEIRTPLNGVNAVAESLARTPLTEAQRGMVEIIRSSGVMLERLLSDILDLARIDAGRLELTPAPFHLGETVSAITDLMAAKAQEKGLALTLDLDPAADRLVNADATRLKQILANLLSNAIKFTETGEVRLSVHPAPEVGTDVWRFTVRDTGIGFDVAQKARLFRRFAQGDGSVTRRYGGVGLGLVIARDLAQKMGGDLDADGVPGVGAVFSLVAPLPPAAAAAEPVAPPEPPPSGGADVDDPEDGPPLKVLVSEDHPVNRMVMEMLLSQISADILSTENGLAACEAFERQAEIGDPFDLVLMDMQMPVMDGLAAIRRIRAFERAQKLRHTAIIMVTANALPEHRQAGFDAGADLFITKPLESAVLFQAIDDLSEPTAA
ncbi:hybrid sensor histidine kinase/response regulator [Phenylobacterium aquaticum]|uniref:hybrid sensor histidine kinase/response regulator n=1 Tax=Phenylobacterium aquaticum TaxID=1763816 RepID=UPI001F5D716D|nr:ATP-binding protein [Phenylobacterium aquaticum]MCI3131221.1 ATP-binding protein [Phenylobacterium aquaticum]